MKKVYHVKKSRLYSAVDFTSVLRGGDLCGHKLERADLEPIKSTDGTFCFFDPYAPYDCGPFTVLFPCGEYKPFTLTEDERIAYFGLDGGGLDSVKEWKLAFTDERDVLKLLLPDETVGTPIGSGLGAVCDGKTLASFVCAVRENEGEFHPLDGFVSMDGSFSRVCPLGEISLTVFNTGYGEGYYSCYIGIGGDGTPRGLICDFDTISYPNTRESMQTVAFELDVDASETYTPDPKKSDADNKIAQYSAAIASCGDDEQALFNAYSRRGYAYHTIGRLDEALNDYLRAIEIGEKLPDSSTFTMHAWSLYDNAALIYRKIGKTDEAISLYESAKSISDTFYSGAYGGLIDIYSDSKNYVKALAVADEMVAARPRDPSAYLRRSELNIACEEYEKAIADLDVLIGDYKLSECILDKAACLSYLGKNAQALSVLDSYLVDGRASEVYYDIRSSIHLADGNFSAAYVDAAKAHDANPDYLPTLEKLIELDSLLFNYKKVVRWATRYIDVRPRSEYAYSVRADAYHRSGEYEEAIADYIFIVQNISADPKYYGLLIRAAIDGGDRGSVKKYLRLLRRTDNIYYIYSVGLQLLDEKKYARAERYLASAFALKQNEIVLSALIDCYIRSGNYAKADVMLGRLCEISDGEDAFIKSSRIAKARGVATDAIVYEYVKRFLNGCEDKTLLDKVNTFFANL